MSTASTRALSTATAAGPATRAGAASGGGVARSLAQLLASNALVSLTGLLCLPVLFRNLGPASYGQLSLFLLLLGLLGSLDVSRPTLVRELSRDGDGRALGELLPLVGLSQRLLVPLALAVGWLVFGPLEGLALGLGTWLFVAASGPYASLAAAQRVGVAVSVRNVAWVVAFVVAAALSFRELPAHAYAWPFVVANGVILLVNRRLSGGVGSAREQRPSVAVWQRFRGRSLDILGLSVATAVVVSADKLLLEGSASAETFGHYAAQYDLATRLHVLSTALGTVLLPALSQRVAKDGFERAAALFVRQAGWIALLFFCGLAGLLLFSDEVLALVLGDAALEAENVYPLLLVGIFFALFGHLITPWQRACGDFRTHRRIYTLAALLMLVVGVVTIPRFGPLGAVLTYSTARCADVLLVASEVRRIPRAILPSSRVALLAGMALALLALGLWRFAAHGGAA